MERANLNPFLLPRKGPKLSAAGLMNEKGPIAGKDFNTTTQDSEPSGRSGMGLGAREKSEMYRTLGSMFSTEAVITPASH